MTARDDMISGLEMFFHQTGAPNWRELASARVDAHAAEVLLRAAAALEVNARQGDQDGLTRIYKRAAVDFLRGMAAETAPAEEPSLSADDLRGGFWPDMTGGLCSVCHIAEVRGGQRDPDCKECRTVAAERPAAPAEDECRCCGKDTAACLCEPDADGTCICAQAPATWRQRTPAELPADSYDPTTLVGILTSGWTEEEKLDLAATPADRPTTGDPMTDPYAFIPPSAEGLPTGALDSATRGASALDAYALTRYGRNLLAHALTGLARDGWLRPDPGQGWEPTPEPTEQPAARPADDTQQQDDERTAR